jgi:hypothetical protein
MAKGRPRLPGGNMSPLLGLSSPAAISMASSGAKNYRDVYSPLEAALKLAQGMDGRVRM